MREGGLHPELRPVVAFGYFAEAHFFDELAPKLDIPLPKTYFAAVDEPENNSLIIFEDLRREGLSFPSMLEPLTPDTVAAGLDVLAAFHAATWDNAGDQFGQRPEGLTLEKLACSPNGVDLGPLEPRLPDLLRTPDGMIDLAPAAILDEIRELAREIDGAAFEPERRIELIGRRNVRSKNSWLRNVATLASGRPRHTLQIHSSDAAALALEDGAGATVSSAVGRVSVTVEVCDALRPGVVSLPHGWSDDLDGCRFGIASARPGPNSNLLADATALDPMSGTAVLNGIPVTITADDAVPAP